MAGSRWQAVAALVDPVRRALYDYVRRQRRAVSREEAAAAQSISRSLTAFHLDKLVDSGLLRARYEAPADQPRGRGRAPKVYEPTGDGIAVALPPRRYELMGEILADAVATEPGAADEAALREAYARGRAEAGGRRAAEADRGDDLERARAALAELGFEPCATAEPPAGPTHRPASGGRSRRLILANCPYRALATRQPELICGINRAFVHGLLTGLGTDRLTARLVPRPGACCVEIGPAGV
jgi:predicted ArsR family transcriptional regulator